MAIINLSSLGKKRNGFYFCFVFPAAALVTVFSHFFLEWCGGGSSVFLLGPEQLSSGLARTSEASIHSQITLNLSPV